MVSSLWGLLGESDGRNSCCVALLLFVMSAGTSPFQVFLSQKFEEELSEEFALANIVCNDRGSSSFEHKSMQHSNTELSHFLFFFLLLLFPLQMNDFLSSDNV